MAETRYAITGTGAAEWVIWYSDGTTYSSLDGKPQDAPALGVVCIRQSHEAVGNALIRPSDWYCYHNEDGEWYGHDMPGLIDYIIQGGLLVIKLGRTVSNELFQSIITSSAYDARLRRKSAYIEHEARFDWMDTP